MSRQQQQQRQQQQEKPWRDEERLRAVREQYDTQSAMASELGCSVSTVSKWLDKLLDASDSDTDSGTNNESLSTPDNHCKFHAVCGNETPGEHNHLCATCLDVLRGFADGVDQDSITGDGSISLDEFRSIYPNTESESEIETESESIY